MSDNYVETKLNGFVTELEEVEKRNSIRYVSQNIDAEKYIMLSPIELNKMSSEECSIAKYVVNQHALSIQKSLNRALAIKNWATRNFEIVTSQEIVYDGTFFRHEVICDKIAQKNSYAKKLRDIMIEEQGKVDTLSHISQGLKEMGMALSNLSYSKKDTNVNH